jgi:hypothetical protein
MCKIAILTKHDPDGLEVIVRKLWRSMSGTERDGYGAAWISPEGVVQTVRSSSPNLSDVPPAYVSGFFGGSFTKSDGGYLLVHARTATCGISLENTHPMQIGNAALIHNGVVYSKKYSNVDTTCDSELLLHAWRQGGVEEIEKEIGGYYAFAVITATPKKRILDIVRDDRACLHVGRLQNGGEIFATTTELVTVGAGTVLGAMTGHTAVRFTNGRNTHTREFTPFVEKLNVATEKMASRAFGGSLLFKEDGMMGDWPSTNWRNQTGTP